MHEFRSQVATAAAAAPACCTEKLETKIEPPRPVPSSLLFRSLVLAASAAMPTVERRETTRKTRTPVLSQRASRSTAARLCTYVSFAYQRIMRINISPVLMLRCDFDSRARCIT